METKEMKLYKCKLCGEYYSDQEMSGEHYPARCVGNEDIVEFDIVKMFDMFKSNEIYDEVLQKREEGKTLKEIADEIFDNKLSNSLYIKGRTARTLCKKCNSFLGKYDEAYLKFFNVDGNADKIKGFSLNTKYKVIKSIYAKFLSIPEAIDESFDFVDFIRDEKLNEYNGKRKLYCVKRNYSTDIMGLKDLQTGKAVFSEGVVYELSDEKFISNIMNFEKHSCYDMTNIFDILKKSYAIVEGVGEYGGYHASILLPKLLFENQEDFSG